jgi:hypothetical protein
MTVKVDTRVTIAGSRPELAEPALMRMVIGRRGA